MGCVLVARPSGRDARRQGRGERVVPVDAAFFAELAAYLRPERPPEVGDTAILVVLRGPTAGAPLGEAALRALLRRHRAAFGAMRVRPHWLRHTYGTPPAAAGIDLLAPLALMGDASTDTTAGDVHLSIDTLAGEYAAACATTAASTR